MTDVFLGYSRLDKAIAENLAKTLTRANWEVFWDKQLVGGSDWHLELENQLGKAKCVVIVWSANASTAPFLINEIEFATEKRKPLIPVVTDDTALPLILMKRQAVFCPKGKVNDDLLRAVAAHIEPGRSQLSTGGTRSSSSETIDPPLPTMTDRPAENGASRRAAQGATTPKQRLLAGMVIATVVAVLATGYVIFGSLTSHNQKNNSRDSNGSAQRSGNSVAQEDGRVKGSSQSTDTLNRSEAGNSGRNDLVEAARNNDGTSTKDIGDRGLDSSHKHRPPQFKEFRVHFVKPDEPPLERYGQLDSTHQTLAPGDGIRVEVVVDRPARITLVFLNSGSDAPQFERPRPHEVDGKHQVLWPTGQDYMTIGKETGPAALIAVASPGEVLTDTVLKDTLIFGGWMGARLENCFEYIGKFESWCPVGSVERGSGNDTGRLGIPTQIASCVRNLLAMKDWGVAAIVFPVAKRTD